MPTRLLIGAMSGTSADGVDVALIEIDGHGWSMRPTLRRHLHRPYPAALRSRIFAIRSAGQIALPELADLARDISDTYADAVNKLLAAMAISPSDIQAIAAHGQTLYHSAPQTIQWLDPSLLAARTRCSVVSDFRRADRAAGGKCAAGAVCRLSAVPSSHTLPRPAQPGRHRQSHFPRRDIASVTDDRLMPPWKALPHFGDFIGIRHLSDDQIATIDAWVKAGKPEGVSGPPGARHFPPAGNSGNRI